MVKYLNGRNTPMNDLEGDINVESDCEDNSTAAGDGTLKNEENEEEIRAVLTVGSFSACAHFLTPPHTERNDELSSWRSLFFYRCTDTISFAPLNSQGAKSRLSYIRGRTVATAPPPCSPKSIYVLAKLVRQLLVERLGA